MYIAERFLVFRQHHFRANFHKNLANRLQYGKYKYGERRVITVLHDSIPCLLSTYEKVTGVNKYLIAYALRVQSCLHGFVKLTNKYSSPPLLASRSYDSPNCTIIIAHFHLRMEFCKKKTS